MSDAVFTFFAIFSCFHRPGWRNCHVVKDAITRVTRATVFADDKADVSRSKEGKRGEGDALTGTIPAGRVGKAQFAELLVTG
jgi:hypothetical protein